MKKFLIPISAAFLFGLAACGQPAVEVTPSAAVTSAPKPTVTVAVTAVPTATPPIETITPAPSSIPAEVTATPEPAPTVAPTPKPTSAPTPVPVLSPEPSQEPAPILPPEVILTPEPTPEPTRPSDEEVLAAYREAQEAYNWFDLATLEGYQEEKLEYQGLLYARVADERFPTMDSFRGYLKTLFSDEVVDGLLPMEGQQYVEIDGQLCVLEGGRGTDITKGAVTLSVVWPQEEEPLTCTVRAEVELLDEETLSTVVGSEAYEFPYQKVGDKWVFTWFAPIK